MDGVNRRAQGWQDWAITMAREMLNTDVRLLQHMQPTLSALSQSYALVLITKGDLRDQEGKLLLDWIESKGRSV